MNRSNTWRRFIQSKAIGLRQKRRWYKTPSNIIAALALMCSLGNMIYTAIQSSNDGVAKVRAQLRYSLAQANSFNPAIESGRIAYKNNPRMLSAVVDNYIYQQSHHYRVAYETLRQLGSAATTQELASVADGLQAIDEYDLAEEMAQKALLRAKRPTEKAGAMRVLAAIQFRQRRIQEGITIIKTALREIESSDFPASNKRHERAYTYVRLAENLLGAGECEKAKSYLDEAGSLIQTTGYAYLTVPMIDYIQSGCNSATPLPPPSSLAAPDVADMSSPSESK